MLRQGLYRFFGEALSSPTDEWLGLVRPAAELLDGLGVEPFAFNREWRSLLKMLEGQMELGRLEKEYVRLFVTGVSPSMSPPIESFYRTQPKGGGTADFLAYLVREYLAMGISVTGRSEAPDHVSTELEVMSVLCSQEVEAWEAGRLDMVGVVVDKEARFLRGHLMTWLPAFKRRVTAADPDPVYRELIGAMHSFVVHDADLTYAILAGVKS